MFTLPSYLAEAQPQVASDSPGSAMMIGILVVVALLLIIVARMVRQVTSIVRPFFGMAMHTAKASAGNVMLAAILGALIALIGMVVLRG
jgi:hypothetical protein